MSSEGSKKNREREIFEKALGLPPDEREAFLDRVCGGDKGLRRSVATLLRLADEDRDKTVDLTGESPRDAAWMKFLDDLKARRGCSARYRDHAEIDGGSMGVVERVFDQDLRRELAMKVIREQADGDDDEAPAVDSIKLGRFLEEAQIAAQLDHPNFLPVHDLGVDERGRLFFTMKLVKGGEQFRAIIDAVHDPDETDWNLSRALSVVLRICEAMSYAHTKGVLHRDLKPGNVMVGRFGEVFVLDWGMAKIIGRDDGNDPTAILGTNQIESLREDEVTASPDSPLRSKEGLILGTPAYMAPEQANGQIDLMGPHSDVYAIGAILYHTLTGEVPYIAPGTGASAYTILRWVREGPPTAVTELKPGVRPELVAICEKAMSREISDRYENASELAADLRAFLEGRVVPTYKDGPLPQLIKWGERNKLAAAALLGFVLSIGIGAFGTSQSIEQKRRTREVQLDADLRRLVRQAEASFVVHPDSMPAMREWLSQAEEVVRQRAELPEDQHRIEFFRTDAEVEEKSGELADAEEMRTAFGDYLAQKEKEIVDNEVPPDALEATLRSNEIIADKIEFIDHRIPRLAWELEGRPEPLANQDHGFISRVRESLRTAEELRARSIDDYAVKWGEVVASGKLAAPQVGLVPVGQDVDSDLWEFWHVLSGERPERDADGKLVMRPETGMVFVLIDGGTARMGTQNEDAEGPHFEPWSQRSEQPVRRVDLDPYFISKYEMTQGQWRRATLHEPSEWFAGFKGTVGERISATHPVERVSWRDCTRVLRLWGLTLPTEMQWEHACRGNTQTTFWAGDSAEDIAESINFADLSVSESRRQPASDTINDGYLTHAPVDTFAPNPYGLYNVTGNVWEWILDPYCQTYEGISLRPGDGLLETNSRQGRVMRGGSFLSGFMDLRCAARHKQRPNGTASELGVRPARAVDP